MTSAVTRIATGLMTQRMFRTHKNPVTVCLLSLGLLFSGHCLAQAATAPVALAADATVEVSAEFPAAQSGDLSTQQTAGTEEQITPPVSELAAAPAVPAKPDEEMEDVKQALVKLKRDLVILEEELLFPASSQVSVFLSMDIGKFFQLDAVTLKLNGKQVAHHLYTEKQVDALHRGGVQKLFVGNVKQGDNRVTAFFTGLGPNGRDFRRATTVEFEKGFEPTFIELAISDETEDYQPDFVSAVSN